MRSLIATLLSAAVLMLILGPISAQDAGPSTTGKLKPDLPLEKPVPEDAEDPPEEEEPPEEEAPPEEQAPPQEAPPEEEPPENPPPEFFEEPIEKGEVIFVIDRTGSMGWPAKISVVDENGDPVNGAVKIDVARIELIKTINQLSDNIKFAMVGYSCPSNSWQPDDTNWDAAARRWKAWPPAQGEPAPWGWHVSLGADSLPVWPTNKALVPATADNKSAAISWASSMLTRSTVRGLTCIYGGMSVALKMVTPAPPGTGPGGEPKKSPTAIYLLTDGAPTHVDTAKLYFPSASYNNDATWEQQCMDLTKAKCLAENIHNATIFTLGMGMDMSCPDAYVWNPGKSDWDHYPTEFCDRCRKFLTELAEATGGHYREVSP